MPDTKCPRCKRKAGISLIEEPEMEDLDFDGSTITGSCNIVLHCDRCGKPIKNKSLEVIQNVNPEQILAAFEDLKIDVSKLEPCELDYRVTVDHVELIQQTVNRPRRRFYGYCGTLQISAQYQGTTATIYPGVEDLVPASEMERI